jgi:uncharacterized protein (TIGR03435 family)
MSSMRRALTTLAIAVLAGKAVAQDRLAPPQPAFAVASVKPNLNDLALERVSVQPDGSARFTGFHLRTLIAMAYRSEGIQRFDQLVDGPSWISVDRFDIAAKTAGDQGAPGDPTQLPLRLRSLLRDRFRLQLHTETRPRPAYGLVVARRDGRLGPSLRETTIECPGGATASADPDPNRWCGIRATNGLITGRAVSAAQLAGNLSGYPAVDRFVADRTGLTGRYDFSLEYASALLDATGAVPIADPSLFTALTEQLGLRLQSETIVVPVLVIDNVERPTPD